MSVQTTYNAAPAIALEGQLVDDAPRRIDPFKNDEASAEIPFGHAVKRNATNADKEAINVAANTDAVLGIVVHSHEYVKDAELGSTGLKPGAVMNVMRQGRIWAVCEDGCSPGDPLFVRAVATGGEVLGELRASADGTDTIDCTFQGTWETSAAAGGLAQLTVNFYANPVDAVV